MLLFTKYIRRRANSSLVCNILFGGHILMKKYSYRNIFISTQDLMNIGRIYCKIGDSICLVLMN